MKETFEQYRILFEGILRVPFPLCHPRRKVLHPWEKFDKVNPGDSRFKGHITQMINLLHERIAVRDDPAMIV